MTEEVLRRRLHRAEHKVLVLESMVEDKTRELYMALQESQKAESFLRNIAAAMPVAVLVYDRDGIIVHANRKVEQLFGFSSKTMKGMPIERCFVAGELPAIIGGSMLVPRGLTDEPLRVEATCLTRAGEEVATLVSAVPVGAADAEQSKLTACTIVDLREQHQREADLRQTQKLESLGRLTAGIAHEINTPAQYVNDSLEFLRDALTDYGSLIAGYREALGRNLTDELEDFHKLLQLEDELDLEYLLEHSPNALDRAIDGLKRISRICRSIKDFSHSHSSGKSAENLNHRILETLEFSRNEYKYVAEVVTEFADLPLIECHGDEIAQVVLNLVVNAAHSIAEKNAESKELGQILIKTCRVEEEVSISISDTGNGIPLHIRERVFDAFFTTKPVGHGSGQGLALARTTVEDRHGGRINVTSEEGTGTEFTIHLPISNAQLDELL